MTEKHEPAERLETYLEHWNKGEFTKMYAMLTEEGKETYAKEDFVDRYEKIYADLGIEKVKVTFKEKEEEDTEKNMAHFTIEANMNSLAGPIQFKKDIQLQLHETEEKEKDWFIDWNPGFIFPELADGGRIKINIEAPKRGNILDRNEMPLAINDIAYEIGVVPGEFVNKKKEIKQIAKLLHLSNKTIDKKLSADWVEDEHFVPLKTIPRSEKSTFDKLLQIPAVTYMETTGRAYPSKGAAAHLTGYIGPITAEEMEKYPAGTYDENDLIGKRGLEQLYEEQLRGEDGVTISVVQEETDEPIVLAEKPVKDGENIKLAIDVNVQEELFAKLENHPGTAAAIQPETGEILALVSSPSFDPNAFTFGISQKKWDQLMNDEEEPFVNRFSATYAPGSVIKPISAAIGLQHGTIKAEEGITINGLTWGKESWGGATIKRVSASGGPVDLRKALVASDNIYFAMKAVEMGTDDYVKGLKQFGFEEEIPIAFPIKTSQIANAPLKDEILLANTSYGQGEMEVSALHMALMYTPIVNKGNLIKPSFLADDKKGEIWTKDLLSNQRAETIQQALRDVVTSGTGKAALDGGLAISGKTGTAELKMSKGEKGHENGWFVGYPTEEQDIIIAFMVQKSEDIGSSSYAARKVLETLKAIQ